MHLLFLKLAFQNWDVLSRGADFSFFVEEQQGENHAIMYTKMVVTSLWDSKQ